MRHTPTREDVRTIWSILAILFCVMLALSLGTTVVGVLAKSAHALEWAVQSISWTIWLFAALYARGSRYYEGSLRFRLEWYRKSRAERIRAVCVFVGVATGLLILIFGSPIFFGMLGWPGQEWGAYMLQAAPALPLVTALLMALVVVRTSARGCDSRDRKVTG